NFALPVVVSARVGSATDLVKAGVNGYIVPHDDLEGLVGALTRLVRSESLRASLGAASRATIADFTYEVTAAGVMAATRAAVGEDRWAAAERYARRNGD